MDQPRWIPQLYGYPVCLIAALCQEERADRVAAVRHRALRSLVTSTLMLPVALLLFGVHWRWLRGSRNAMT